jgi:kumamolisin
MVAAPAAQTASVPYPQPVYVSCFIGGPSHLLVFFTLNDQSRLTSYLNDAYYNPESPSYHQFISADQFDDEYSAPSWVFSTVESIFRANGLTTVATGPMLIEGTGDAQNVQSALGQLAGASKIQSYIIGAECMPQTYNGLPSKDSQAPAYTPTDTRGVYVGSTPLSRGSSGGGSNACTYQDVITDGPQIWLPCGLQTIYDDNPLINQGSSGSHQTIALVDAYGDPNNETGQVNVHTSSFVYDNIACSDFAAFNAEFNLPQSACSVIYPTGVPQLAPYNAVDAEGWATETAIDMQYSHTMAPQAHILEVTSSTDYDDLYASIEYVVNNQLASMISLSFGSWEDGFFCTSAAFGCGPPVSAALMLGYDEIFQQAAAEGIGVFASSGDYAAYNPVFAAPCTSPVTSTCGVPPYGEVSASSPATDPWVSAVGGTTLLATFTAHTVTRTETAWSFGSDSYNTHIGTGGGFSMVFKETQGQQRIHISTKVTSIPEPALGITFYPQGQRGEPDLAADADPSTGVLIVQDGAFSPYVWGGTSLAAPLTAGMDATVQSNMRHFTIGVLAPSLYEMYSPQHGSFYVQQTQFSINQFNFGVQGTMFQTASGQNGEYSVTPGVWNPVDGLGQLNVYALSQAISNSFGNLGGYGF